MIKGLKRNTGRRSKKDKRERILKNYYSRELSDGKSSNALLIDKILFRIFIFILLGIFLNHKSKTLILSFFISGIWVYFFDRIFVKLKKKKEYKKKQELIEGIKRRKVIKEINNSNKNDFINYIKSILEKYYDLEISYGNYFDLEYVIGEEKHAIRCIKLGLDERVSIRELEDFNWELRRHKINAGMVVTNSYFSEEIQIEDSNVLCDIDGIILMLKQLKMYPNKEDVEDHIVDRFLNNRNSKINGMLNLNFKKVLQIYGLFAIFYLISYFVKYSLYYRIFSILIFSIITVIIGYKIFKVLSGKDHPLDKKIKS